MILLIQGWSQKGKEFGFPHKMLSFIELYDNNLEFPKWQLLNKRKTEPTLNLLEKL